MKESPWRKWGLAASIGAFVMPLVIAAFEYGKLHEAMESPAVGLWLAIFFVAASMIFQGFVIVSLIRKTNTSTILAIRAAQIHALVALALGVGATVIPGLLDSQLFIGWMSGWLGPDLEASFRPPLSFLPLLLLAQWVCFTKVKNVRPSREVWRGVALSGIGLSAVLGLWTFSPLTGGHWTFFEDPIATFFNIGVAVHLVAILFIARRSRFDWLASGIVGFGCLVSGFILTRIYNGKLMDADQSVAGQIGGFLYVGWYGLAHYLPIVAYVLTACASVALARARSGEAGSKMLGVGGSCDEALSAHVRSISLHLSRRAPAGDRLSPWRNRHRMREPGRTGWAARLGDL